MSAEVVLSGKGVGDEGGEHPAQLAAVAEQLAVGGLLMIRGSLEAVKAVVVVAELVVMGRVHGCLSTNQVPEGSLAKSSWVVGTMAERGGMVS